MRARFRYGTSPRFSIISRSAVDERLEGQRGAAGVVAHHAACQSTSISSQRLRQREDAGAGDQRRAHADLAAPEPRRDNFGDYSGDAEMAQRTHTLNEVDGHTTTTVSIGPTSRGPAATPFPAQPRSDHRGSGSRHGHGHHAFVELRKRRGLMIALIAVNIGIPVVFLAVRLISHAVDPRSYRPAGGYSISTAGGGRMYIFGFIVAAVVGCTGVGRPHRGDVPSSGDHRSLPPGPGSGPDPRRVGHRHLHGGHWLRDRVCRVRVRRPDAARTTTG